MTVQANVQRAKAARAAVRAHCLALRVEESSSHLLVTFPPGFCVAGVRVSMANGVVWASEKALEKMEEFWKI